MKKLLALLLLLSFPASAAPFGGGLLLSSGPSYAPNAWSYWNGGSGNNYVGPFPTETPNQSYIGSLSLWFKLNAGPGSQVYLTSNNGATAFTSLTIGSEGTLSLVLSNGSSQFDIVSNAGAVTGTGWHNVLASWNTNAGAHSKTGNLYLDGNNVVASLGDSGSAFQVAADPFLWGNISGGIAQNQNFSMSEIWIGWNQFIDFSQLSNRQLFYNNAAPVSLGSSGQIPTGTSPWIYLKGPASSVGTNSGTGGNGSVTGTISSVVGP